LAFGLAGRAAHQGCSTFCCAGKGDGTGAAVAFDAANAAVTAAPPLMNSRRPKLDSGKGDWDFFIFVSWKNRRGDVIVPFVAAQMPQAERHWDQWKVLPSRREIGLRTE
jgi:hypothetical protein